MWRRAGEELITHRQAGEQQTDAMRAWLSSAQPGWREERRSRGREERPGWRERERRKRQRHRKKGGAREKEKETMEKSVIESSRGKKVRGRWRGSRSAGRRRDKQKKKKLYYEEKVKGAYIQ